MRNAKMTFARRFAAGILLAIFASLIDCKSVQTIQPHNPGSVQNPILLNGFEGQVQYLQSLKTESGPVDFEFEKTVPGYDNHYLDVYLISPPDPSSELEKALEEPPDFIRIYLDGYHPERNADEAPVPPGYRKQK